MAISLADLQFATTLQEMSDEDFLLTWHAEIWPTMSIGYVGRERGNPTFRLIYVAPPLRS